MNKITTQEFLSVLYAAIAPEKYIELRLILAQKARPKAQFFAVHNYDAIVKYAQEYNGKYNIYFGVAPRDRLGGKTADVSVISCLWADLDAKDFGGDKSKALARIAEFPLEASIIVDTGNGYHGYWLLQEAVAADAVAVEYLTRLAQALGGDKVYDLPRILRLPDTLNIKEEHKPCNILHLSAKLKYTLDDFDEYLPAVSVQKIIQEVDTTDVVLGDNESINQIIILTSSMWIKNTRQNMCLALTGWMLKAGYDSTVVTTTISGIVDIVKDEERSSRFAAVNETVRKFMGRRPIAGYTQFNDIVESTAKDLSELDAKKYRASYSKLKKILGDSSKLAGKNKKIEKEIALLRQSFNIQKIEKIEAEEPLYIMHFEDNKRLKLDINQLTNFKHFKLKHLATFNYQPLVYTSKESWDAFVNEILIDCETIAVNAESTYEGGIVHRVIKDYIAQSTSVKEDLTKEEAYRNLMGNTPAKYNNVYYARSANLLNLLRNHHIALKDSAFQFIMQDSFKASHVVFYCNSKSVRVWCIPLFDDDESPQNNNGTLTDNDKSN